ncbi:related to Aquaporin 3 [Sporisorium reilianum SRZ2]|uniref:Related to Aquaporin 3 n=1 Tax=Sporisorium reilianum (strain SRZ2) TaxID=999809 RepID=E6ZWW2_SPORE|nr:related to Aquaporin 3 [Sporisorium reilianum SRZ2]
MSRLTSHAHLSDQQVHPDPTSTDPLLPSSAPLPHQATPLHKPPRWWTPPAGSSSPDYATGYEPNSWAKLRHLYREELAEFFGTFLILLFGAGVECQVNMHYHASATRDVAAYGSYFQGRLAWAAGVAMAGWVSGGISGGHCNPSVTVALALFRGFPWRKVVPFVVAQTLGATVASLLVYANNVTNIERFQHAAAGGAGSRTVKGAGSTAGFFFTLPAPELSFGSAFFSEFLATSVLVFVIFALADTANLKPPKGSQPFAMFIVLLGIGASLGYNTGYAINGARDTGPRIALWLVGYGGEVWTHDGGYWAWGPWVASVLGGAVGGAVYDVFLYTGRDSPVNRPKRSGYRVVADDEAEE